MGNPANEKTINQLTKEAVATFEEAFGKPEAKQVQGYQADPSPPMSTPPKSSPTSFAPPSLPSVALPEGKDFSIWKDDKANYGKKDWTAWGKPWPEVTWNELLQHAKEGDDKAIKAIQVMAGSDPGPSDGKWLNSNLRKIGRAKAVQMML